MQKIIIFSILTIAAANPGFIYYTPDTYPDSMRDFGICRLSQPGLICDPNQMLGNVTNINNQVAGYINNMLTYTQKSTNCSCQNRNDCMVTPEGLQGVTISIALLHTISTDNTPEEQTPEGKLHLIKNFANALRFRQRRGSCDDDVLVVITADMIYTSVGDSTSQLITKDVIDNTDVVVLPYLRAKDYNRALVEMITQYSTALNVDNAGPLEAKPWYSPLPLWAVYAIGGGIVLLLVIIVVSLIVCLIRRKQKTRGYSVGLEASRNNQRTRM